MKLKKWLSLLIIGTGTFAYAALPKDTVKTLGPGEYSAKVKSIVCSGCGPFIEKTMKALPGIESAVVNQEKQTVQFKVKKDASIKVGELQKSLQASSQRMGMGADYSLSDIKKLKQ